MRNLALILLVLVLSGCAHYDGAKLTQLSDRNLVVGELTHEMCEDFDAAADASLDGPDRAYPFLGRSEQIKNLAVVMGKHAGQCFLIVARMEDPETAFTDAQKASILENFKRSWKNAKELAKD